MKHILNNLSEEEKNKIRNQYVGGYKLVIENFSDLVNYKLGDIKPLSTYNINEQDTTNIAKKNWENVKDYLLKYGFPPDIPYAGWEYDDKNHSVAVFDNNGSQIPPEKGYYIYFYPSGEVHVNYIDKNNNIIDKKTTWEWDGTKPIIPDGYKINYKPTTQSKGQAKTEQDILSNNKTLKLGNKGELVKSIQSALFKKIDWAGVVTNPGCKSDNDCDGVYGKNTKKAVEEYQRKNKLNVDGEIGRQTYIYLMR